MPLHKFEPHLRQLLTSGVVHGRCAVFLDNIPKAEGHCGEFVTFKSWMDYPKVFTRVPIDIEGAEIRMSGMFGEITCVFLNGKWATHSHHPRTPTQP
jgi:hypothetical protein